jgi:hypothetical protein
MSRFELAIRHITEGMAYSWDLTVVLGLGIVLPDSLREKLLSGRTGPEEAAYVYAIYTRAQLSHLRR